LWSWFQQITVKLIDVHFFDQRRLCGCIFLRRRKNSGRRRGHTCMYRRRGKNGRSTKTEKISSGMQRTHSSLRKSLNKRDTSRHNRRDYAVVTSKRWQRHSMRQRPEIEDAEEVWESWNLCWWIPRWKGKLVLKTQELVKRGKLAPGRESKFQIGSVTREREELERKFRTQSRRNWEWDNPDLENTR